MKTISPRYCSNCKKKIEIGGMYYSGRGLPATICPDCAVKIMEAEKE